MLSTGLISAAILLMAMSGLPACFLSSRRAAGQRIAAVFMTMGGASGLAGLVAAVPTIAAAGATETLHAAGFAAAIDPIGALFLALVFVVAPLGSIYALGYWKQSEHEENGRRLGLFYGILAASMALVLVARDGLGFLIAWEAMALAAYFASTAESDKREVRRAGWIYLIATHVGTLCLFAMFALMRSRSGSFAFAALDGLPPEAAGAIFVLALVGFGLKAGIMPLHLWLPGAHANAPSHVSALMSGVMLKMGVYGIIRVTSLLPAPADWWGGVLLGAGALTGIAGILFAIGQSDLKRALAYSSIENVGIIAMGLGLALLGRSFSRWDWVALGMGGALLHCINHGLFKPLLFLGAGSVMHGTGTREMESMGGLAKSMPRTAALFALGAVAICALPPLNGFASEWLLYLGFFGALGVGAAGGTAATVGAAGPAAASAAVALAMIGALALACFVKIYGSIFLGAPRGTQTSKSAHESPASMLAPMAILAAGCAFLGLFPAAAAPFLNAAIGAWAGPSGVATGASALSATTVPFQWITRLGLALVALAILVFALSWLASYGKRRAASITWDCGYAAPSPRMEYTGASFTRGIGRLFSFVLWPKSKKPEIGGAFPRAARFESSLPDPVLDRLMTPLFNFAGRQLPRVRVFQQGQTHLYVLYVLAITIALLVLTGLGA